MAQSFRADHIGSLLRYEVLLEARASHGAGRIEDSQLKEIEYIATLDALGMQGQVGIDVFRAASSAEAGSRPRSPIPLRSSLSIRTRNSFRAGEASSGTRPIPLPLILALPTCTISAAVRSYYLETWTGGKRRKKFGRPLPLDPRNNPGSASMAEGRNS